MCHRLLGSIVCGFLLMALSGCGDQSVPAKGTVTWEDGTPISGASIRLVPKEAGKPDAVGGSDKDGQFTLNTQGKDGAPPGEYTAVVIKMPIKVEAPAAAPGTESPEQGAKDIAKSMKGYYDKNKKTPQNELPGIYSEPSTSPLKVNIVRGNPNIELKLKKS
jgi:hypothetical protein